MDNIIAYITSSAFLLKGELFLRIIIAVLCGAFIGYERTNRGKGAGIRTHTIVAVASCLMMIVSQYGFEDFFGNFNYPNVDARLDPSRIASQIVSGIGFLGAGMIFIQKNNITGLTTAAGIWAVAGIGMAIGSGMYFIGISCTVIISVVQLILHKNSKFYSSSEHELVFVIEDTEDSMKLLLDTMREFEITVQEFSYTRRDDINLEVVVLAKYGQKVDISEMTARLYQEKSVKSAKV